MITKTSCRTCKRMGRINKEPNHRPVVRKLNFYVICVDKRVRNLITGALEKESAKTDARVKSYDSLKFVNGK